jgi:plasmid stabilization system protein ParE
VARPPHLPILPVVRQDIRAALAFTKKRFGPAKARDYSALVRLALRTLSDDPRAGKPRPEIHAAAWAYPIAKRGRNARHLFLYEIVQDEARIYGLFYDGMDLPAQWKGRTGTSTDEDE